MYRVIYLFIIMNVLSKLDQILRAMVFIRIHKSTNFVANDIFINFSPQKRIFVRKSTNFSQIIIELNAILQPMARYLSIKKSVNFYQKIIFIYHRIKRNFATNLIIIELNAILQLMARYLSIKIFQFLTKR